jgi:Putative beta-barrel porin 2
LHAEFEQISDIYPSQLNSYEYIGRIGIDYLITPKISLGGEGVIGYLDPQDGGQTLYGQGRLRASYRITQKFSFLASAGFEIRDYQSLNYIAATPVFDLGFDWSPFVDTNISLTAFRKVFASPVQLGENFTATGLQVGASQRFFQRFTAAVYAGYENDTYHRNQSGALESGRNDDYVYVRPSISYDWGGWFRAVVYYQFGRNSSSLDAGSFNDNRVGMQVIFAF